MCNLYEYELQEWEIAHLIEHYKLLGMNWTEAMKVYPNRPGAVVVDRAGERVVVDMLWGSHHGARAPGLPTSATLTSRPGSR
jgi:putative SOS response-associated peptidase YedK